jgi:fatty-acyl-CoA synthase
MIFMNAQVNKLSSALNSIGCSKGDRIGIWAPNCYEWIVTHFAVAKLGSILVRDDEMINCKHIYLTMK